jgi:hypothetical protein
MKTQPDPDQIAAEAVGQIHGSAPPDFVKERERMSPEEIVRRNAKSAGSRASIAEKTAESVGERVADAYSNPPSDRVVRWNAVLTILAGFGLGYIAGVLIHRRG